MDAEAPATGTIPSTAAGSESPPDSPMDEEGDGFDAADWPAMPPDEAAASAVENRPAAVRKAPAGGAAEEDRLRPTPAPGEIFDDAPDPADERPRMPADAPPNAVVSVSPAHETATAEAPPALEPIPWVRLAKRKLRKQVAFIGLFSRAVNVGEEIKAYLQDRLWPVFEEQCEDTLTLIRTGDTDFPMALNALMRGPYGHLNSFELTTVARFNGLNAIVSGTIIDIRVAKELGGILWYKTPEGQLRITILVEVYDAETGTKLLDRIYIREEEVAELEPGAGEKPRNEDQAVLDRALQSIAEDMGDDVCDVLEDQPWRVFVAGIDGKRITLSAGENVGLQAGNILRVHNSQIIDGMNNQQFFLTGEKVGRIQIINLFANHAEALLIEGQGLRDYSVVIPE